ncbi:MAG TPA: LamG domain-containing protein, partial [Verrucomicrobiae bacterium]
MPLLTWAGAYNLTTAYESYWFRTTNGPTGNFTNYFGSSLTNASTLTYGGHVLGNTDSNFPAAGNFGLPWSSFGQPVESIQSDLALGDVIQPPPDANTNVPPANFIAVQVGDCTNAYYQSTNDGTFWVPSTRQIIAGQANNITIYWVTTNHTLHVQSLNVDSVPRTRPARLFWTESPYDAPGVSLDGLFAAIHYNDQVIPPTTFYTTNNQGVITTNEAGVWIDEETKQLHAKNVSGTFILEYYQTGSYKTQVQPVGIEIVQVLEPTVQVLHADVGGRLMPLDTYWAEMDRVNGVIPNVTRGLNETAYIHDKAGPKNNWAFAIRRTYFEPWALEIYWQHRGLMGVEWPYEVDWYSCDWPAYPQVFIAAASDATPVAALIPTELNAQIQEDADPPYHAQISVSGRSFTATEPGVCLVKYTSYDDVWFDVVRTIYSTNAYYFDLEPREWPIGEELTPGGDQTYAMGFDGLADYVAISDSFVNQRTNWTISLWFKAGDSRKAVLYSEGDPSTMFYIKQDYTNLVVSTYNKTRTTHTTSRTWTNAPLVPGPWHYLTLVYSGGSDTGGSLRIYLDNETWTATGLPRVNFDGEKIAVLGGSCTGSPGVPASFDVDSFFYGKVDSLRIWTTALSWDQVRAGAETNRVETAGRLVADFSFNEGYGQVAHNNAGDKDATACAGAFWCYGRVVPGQDWSGFPGYIYLAPGEANNDRYNIGVYSYPTELNQGANSYIFAVNTGQLEVWWAHRSRQPGMPPVYYPSQVVRYTNVWPSVTPQIVIASGLGSSGDSLMPTEDALYFKGTSTSCVIASNNPAMDVGNELTLEAWVYLPNPGGNNKIISWMNTISNAYSGYVLGVYANAIDVEFWTGAGTKRSLYGDKKYGVVPTNEWTHIAYTFNANNPDSIITYVNGKRIYAWPYAIGERIRTSTSDLYIGRPSWTMSMYTTGCIGEVRIWNKTRSAEQIAATWHTRLVGNEPGLVAYYPFNDGAGSSVLQDLGPNRLNGTIGDATWVGQGRPVLASPLALAAPSIYHQNDPAAPGYNPNEEHALVLGGIAYALRDDLNITNGDGYTSDRFVLVDYLDPATAHPKMQLFSVLETNNLYTFHRSVSAGKPILPPTPLAEMPLCASNTSCTQPPAWCDRKNGWWAVSAGADGGTAEARMHFYYEMQASFFFPDPSDQARYLTGAQVPWLPRLSDHNDGLDAPIPVVYTVTWPEAPLLRLGQTLTKAKEGLPEIWDQLSVDVVYEQAYEQTQYDPQPRHSVDLFDPAAAR